MASKPRVVFDTNIFISAIIFGGNPRTCLDLARSGEIHLFTSKKILLELARKLREKFLWQESDIRDVIEGLLVFTTVVSLKIRVSQIKLDEPDNRILECANACKTEFIVSGDKKHLLARGEFKSIPIIKAKEFLDLFYGD